MVGNGLAKQTLTALQLLGWRTRLIIVVCASVLSPPALAQAYPTDIIKVATAELFDAVNAARESTEQNPRLARAAVRCGLF
jgi:ABC-type transporter MlaC component